MRNRHITQLARAHEELKAIKVRLESENLYLRETVVPKGNLSGIVATSPAMTQVMEFVTRVAATESTVLVLGETGTGKELLARAIHRLSRRKDRLLIAVNCAALPASLVESELFGREKGAYTGALARQAGRFEVADGSTLFLDEVGELPLDLQAKLLRPLAHSGHDGERHPAGRRRDQIATWPHHHPRSSSGRSPRLRVLQGRP
jgi:formate hydrogenlyase transcriptional activator